MSFQPCSNRCYAHWWKDKIQSSNWIYYRAVYRCDCRSRHSFGDRTRPKWGVFFDSKRVRKNGYGTLSPTGYSLLACFIAELVLTGLFIFVIFASASRYAPKGFAGISIGFTLVFVHIVGIPITSTSVNPARSLDPAIFVGGESLMQLWLFWLAPILGGIFAALLWRYLFAKTEPAE